MSVTNIAVPLELDQNVRKWNEDDVGVFLMANMEENALIDTDIQAVKIQRVCGIDLLRLKVKQLKWCGIPIGPAERIVALVEKLKVAKGLVPGK
jgi:hypothetical protein